VIFSASKMFFAYGLGNSCSFTLHAGATAILLCGRPEPATVLALLSRHPVTVFFGFPTLYGAILAAIDNARPAPLEHLRLCVSAGEALPAALADRWSAAFGLDLLDGIGSTGGLHIFISNRPDDVKRATSGKPVDGYEIALRDDNGRAAATGEIADLWCRGPSIMAGYWKNPAATERALIDGWLRTGDKYFRDAEGYYHSRGRADDMLKVGGVWVSPHEVEAALLDHPAMLEAAVVGRIDANALIKPKAFVVLKDPATASPEFAEGLKQFVKQRIVPYKYPRWIEFRTDLPRTATGKIRRALLREHA
jgi:benzoate-CoA ligase